MELNHVCRRYHYGDMSLIRDCCVAHAQAVKANAQQVALTDAHPAYKLWIETWNGLTDAEMALVGDWSISALLPRLQPTGVLTVGDWSVKLLAAPTWRVQVEHFEPARGGWVRYQLADGPVPHSFATLEEAQKAGAGFLASPALERCVSVS